MHPQASLKPSTVNTDLKAQDQSSLFEALPSMSTGVSVPPSGHPWDLGPASVTARGTRTPKPTGSCCLASWNLGIAHHAHIDSEETTLTTFESPSRPFLILRSCACFQPDGSMVCSYRISDFNHHSFFFIPSVLPSVSPGDVSAGMTDEDHSPC
jgi:hypothetical protein